MALSIESTRSIPRSADAVGLAVASSGTIPRQLGLNRSALSAQGFEGKIGQTLVVLGAAGATLVAVGIGDPRKIT